LIQLFQKLVGCGTKSRDLLSRLWRELSLLPFTLFSFYFSFKVKFIQIIQSKIRSLFSKNFSNPLDKSIPAEYNNS